MPRSLADSIRERIERFKTRQRTRKNAVRVLAEGDSWFTYGGVMWFSKSLISRLNDYQTVNIVSLAQPGDILERMVSLDNRQWVLGTNPDWVQPEAYDLVLFSGGGNDIIGDEFPDYLLDKVATGFSGRDLINQTVLDDRLLRMANQFAVLRATVDAVVGPKPILTHGYDYAIPSGAAFELLGGLITVGPWLKNQLLLHHIEDLDEQQVIVNELVDQFNQLLSELATTLPNFHYLDLRNTLSAEHWADELHPNATGRDRLAARFRLAIVEASQA